MNIRFSRDEGKTRLAYSNLTHREIRIPILKKLLYIPSPEADIVINTAHKWFVMDKRAICALIQHEFLHWLLEDLFDLKVSVDYNNVDTPIRLLATCGFNGRIRSYRTDGSIMVDYEEV